MLQNKTIFVFINIYHNIKQNEIFHVKQEYFSLHTHLRVRKDGFCRLKFKKKPIQYKGYLLVESKTTIKPTENK